MLNMVENGSMIHVHRWWQKQAQQMDIMKLGNTKWMKKYNNTEVLSH